MFGHKGLSMATFLLFALLPVLALAFGVSGADAGIQPTGAEATLFAGVVVLFVMGLMLSFCTLFERK